MKIAVGDFMDMHPKHIHCASDYYYVRVANELKDILVFIEDNGAMSITPNGACGVKAVDNPLYSPAKAPMEALRLLLSTESTTAGMSRYLVENCLLADACLNSMVSPERGRQLVQENMDFLARCLRRCCY